MEGEKGGREEGREEEKYKLTCETVKFLQNHQFIWASKQPLEEHIYIYPQVISEETTTQKDT